jgi:epsilon-lactone hydrolase
VRALVGFASLVLAALPVSADGVWKQAVVDKDGVYHVPAILVPPSDFASAEAKHSSTLISRTLTEIRKQAGDLSTREGALKYRKTMDAAHKKIADAMLEIFPVTLTPQTIGGVATDIVLPKAGVSAANQDRVLINLHGGGIVFGARYVGFVESIPIASVGRFKIITVDYRMAPEYRHPAATDDVAKVYAALLKQYRPENIGIYGCSSGAWLTASAVAWFQAQHLPTPGAIGLAGMGVAAARGDIGLGDSVYLAGAFGLGIPPYPVGNLLRGDAYLGKADPESPLVFPASHPDVLARFPPTLIVNSTRDQTMSNAIYTHAQLVKAGVDADLHIWDGMEHCFIADPNLPEAREAYDVFVKFFDQHLGRRLTRN